MKKNDVLFLIFLVVLFYPFFAFEAVQNFYNTATAEHGLLMSFAKFAILATLGEMIGLRISEGVYLKEGFGLLPRAIFWGFTGMLIKIAFIIFATGAPVFVDHYVYHLPENVMATGFTPEKLLTAFAISATMNLLFAPIFMILHKVSDIHIQETNGKLGQFFSLPDFSRILQKMDWSVMWGFVFKKTLPLFWIPAHTLTFMLPPNLQILFAAFLGIVLGVILAFAGTVKSKQMHVATA